MTMSIWEFKEDGTSQAELDSLLTEYTTHLSSLHRLATSRTHKEELSVMVPWSLVQWIDDGKRPDGWLKVRLEAVKEANSRLEGKHQTVAQFRDALVATLQEVSSSEALSRELGKLDLTMEMNALKKTNAATEKIDEEEETIDINS